ncbi:anthranilate synthase / indole-3-glycerol phosphate synthase [Dimargaris cristalligena]|nr:anthranilate synthase / indole-3-glycerol phosphate synthase [Dimargaris cristalligena]
MLAPKPLVKICGIRHLEDLQMATEAGADFLGIILANSKRRVDLETAQAMASWLRKYREDREQGGTPVTTEVSPDPPTPTPTTTTTTNTNHIDPDWFHSNARRLAQGPRPLLVGVFLNQPLVEILDLAERIPLDMVQLHGTQEPAHWCLRIPRPVIRVFHVDANFTDYDPIARPGFYQVALLDAKVAGVAAGDQGGRGVAFDWELTRPVMESKQPYGLAGGLNPDNVAAAVRMCRPWLVDVSSGVERGAGELRKDAEKVRRFVAEAKGTSTTPGPL